MYYTSDLILFFVSHLWQKWRWWYRYDTRFGIPIYGEDDEITGYNVFHARLLIRHAASGKKYLYDVMEIKKETSKPCQVETLPSKKPIS